MPLKGRTALVGENANIVATGGGSGFVNPFASTTLSAALKKAKPNLIVLTDDVIYDDVNAEVYMDAAMTKKVSWLLITKIRSFQELPIQFMWMTG